MDTKCSCKIIVGSPTFDQTTELWASNDKIQYCPLHAAAPDMLEACHTALKYINKHCHVLMPAERCSKHQPAKLRAAIAKATGKKQIMKKCKHCGRVELLVSYGLCSYCYWHIPAKLLRLYAKKAAK